MTGIAPFRRYLVKDDLVRMNLPEEFWFAKVQRVSETVRSAVERYLRQINEAVSNGLGLMVCGPKGTGKTAVAALIAKEARSRGHTVLFCRIWELREMIRSRMSFDGDASMAERSRDVDVLILDDLRSEDAGEKFFTLSEITELVRYRASRHRVTIVTTRLDKQSLNQSPMSTFLDVLVLFPVIGPDMHDRRKQDLKRSVFGE